MKVAGKLAGLHVLCVLDKPCAAAITYSLDWVHYKKERNALIFYLGGSTLNVTVITVK